MDETRRDQKETFDRLPPEWSEDLLPAIQERVRASGKKVVVLDDDPTGTQTVHDVAVLTKWPVDQLVEELRGNAPVFYLLTNSRSLPPAEAQALSTSIGRDLREASRQAGVEIALVSRSDSTLRGHFPGEVSAVARELEEESGPFDAWLVVPFFIEGGRFTIDDVHYVADGENLVPAGQTEFARDKSFGYQSSNLREWVAEKTNGSVPAWQVAAISLEDLRAGGPRRVFQRLMELPRRAICVVNAASYRDLEVLVLALLEAEAQGKRYLYRTAASFVRVRAGIAPQPQLRAAEILGKAQPGQHKAGLVVAGSYVPKTTAQLETLFQQTDIEPVEIQVERLLDDTSRAIEVEQARNKVNQLLAEGRNTVLYTSRKLVSAEGAERNLAIGAAVSESLVAVVQGLQIHPAYLLAKGGITSSDLATRGLGIRRAQVLGQVLPGVPVWLAGPESRYPGLAYIVFPGNVGGPDALARIVTEFSA